MHKQTGGQKSGNLPKRTAKKKKKKKELKHCWWDCELLQSLRKTIRRFLKKSALELSYCYCC